MAMLLGGLSMNTIGNLKSLFPEIWENLATNLRYRKYVEKEDISTFKTRLRNEGLPFLTQVLPRLGKALDRYHSICEWSSPPDFKLDENGFPIFLGKCLAGCLSGDPMAVDCYRQLTLMFYKLEVDFDQDVKDEFLANFKKIDSELPLSFDQNNEIIVLARRIIHRVLCNSNPLDIRPCHGTGATACRTKNHEKWHKLRYYAKLDAIFSYPEYFFYNSTHLVDEMDKIEEAVESLPRARVCLVPKDSRGPRIISCEPAELLFIQQGLMRKLYGELQTNPLTRSYVNFEDQDINRALAKFASETGDFATLDLSDASDRVSLALVRSLFPPRWVEALEACRSEETVLPSGEIVKLNKFAPMGSSVCFPVEALVFWAISLASIQSVRLHSNHRSLDVIKGRDRTEVYVYGDDIIVLANEAKIVMDGLESVGLKVNRDKSYTVGYFRESCGGDFYKGIDVTPVRIRKFISASSSSAITDADLANSFIAKFGIDNTVSLVNIIDHAHGIPLPRTSLQLPGCIRSGPCASNDVFYRRRWNYDLQRYEHRIPQSYTRVLARREAAWSELLRKELTRDSSDSPLGKYGSSIRKIERALDPGYYADVHSAHMKWTWTWLG
jgi:hypothetical protein